jgi:hypothetical protein
MLLKRILIPLCFLSFSFTPLIIAQDSTEADEGWKWQWEDVEEWVDFWKKKPSISLHYGFSNISRKDVITPFANNNLIELKLGYTTRKNTRYAEYLNKHKYRYIFITNNSTKLAGGSETTRDIETSTWRFGFGRASGYGYKVGESASVVPYFAYSMDWTRIDFGDDSLNANDERVKELYDGTFRFGSSNEAGIRFQATRLLTVEAGFERSIVFERHLFWKWAGSGIIELVAHGLLDAFLNEILESSPAAGPVVFFILKSALGYGLYELKQDKMNWPFTSAPPIAFDNIKFGMTFVF